MGSPVRVEPNGPVLVITLGRPAVRNAVNAEMTVALEAAVDVLETGDEYRVGVLTGDGPMFCAGADLGVVAAGRLADVMTPRGGFAGLVRRARRKPLIAALNGDALAGGMEIAIACDLLVAVRGARLGIPEASRSLLAIGGGLVHLPRLIGEKAALELAMTALPWPVERFAALGLISSVVERADLLRAAFRLAEAICANAPLAVAASRAAILDGRDKAPGEHWVSVESALDDLAGTADYREGLASFQEKRAPRWTGR